VGVSNTFGGCRTLAQMERGTHDKLEREEALREEWNDLVNPKP